MWSGGGGTTSCHILQAMVHARVPFGAVSGEGFEEKALSLQSLRKNAQNCAEVAGLGRVRPSGLVRCRYSVGGS